jgi:hypothetical protein
MAHDQEVEGSNPGTVYWMDVSNLLANYVEEKLKIKVAEWSPHTQKKEILFSYKILFDGSTTKNSLKTNLFNKIKIVF